MEIMYVRVSTEDQNPDVQIELARRRGIEDRFIYQEKRSGKDVEGRPEFQRMMSQVRSGDTVIVYSIDRFGRNLIDILTNVKKLHEMGVKFQSIMEPAIDTTTEFGELVLGIMAVIAEYHRKYILRKTAEGREEARRQGRHLGRRSNLKEKDEARIYTLWKGGDSLKAIAAEFGISIRTVSRVIERKKEIDQS